jgi:hypothetical protein
MKTVLSAIAITVLCASSVAAQNTAQSASGASSFSGVNIGGSNVEGNAPSAIAPSLGGNHPCAWVPAVFGFSIVGLGISGGGQEIDDACMLGQMGYHQAAIYMIAARNGAACEALRLAGHVSECNHSRIQANEVAAAEAPTGSAYRFCRLADDGNLRAAPRAGFSNDQASEACLQAWRAGEVN